MTNKTNVIQSVVIPFKKQNKSKCRRRKSLRLNEKKKGSITNVGGKIYFDFRYLGKRVRESSGLTWNKKNCTEVRNDLDKMIVAITSGTFRFSVSFPNSKEIVKQFFTEEERRLFSIQASPKDIKCKDYFDKWYNLLKDSGRVEERTLLGYKGYINLYLSPFFSKYTFAELNAVIFDRFISWAKKQCYRGNPVSNKSLNKKFTVLKMICKKVGIEYGWSNYNPFFNHKKLKENDSYDDIKPFSIEEQTQIVEQLPEHWKPYFKFAFNSGLRQGEQIALKPEDIDWENKILHIRRAMTLDEKGKQMEGKTKSKYSRRSFKLTVPMFEALKEQKKIYDQYKGTYFFCCSSGSQVCRSNLLNRIWIPTLEKAGMEYREMRQTRHTFATMALSSGESPLWIAKIMGHRNSEMIIKVYAKHIEKSDGNEDGKRMSDMIKERKGVESNNE
ncbi:MAG: tyrosine-type recombinase/integrase [bacterium]